MWTSRRWYRVGSIDGDEWEIFGRVHFRAWFDESGNLHLMDDEAGRIVVVDQRGELVREFGRLGEGPGELSGGTITAVGFAVLRDGRAVVFDPGHNAFQVFAASGEFERAVPHAGNS